MIVYRTTDRIPVQVGELELTFAPLSFAQKTEINSHVKLEAGKEQPDALKVALLYIKYGVKGLKGCELSDGSEYEVELDESGNMTDASVNDVMSLESSPQIIRICALLANQIAKHEVPGVTVHLDKVTHQKKA